MSASTVTCGASAVASGRRLKAFRFGFYIGHEYRTVSVVALHYSEACATACAVTHSNDSLHYRDELPLELAVTRHALRGPRPIDPGLDAMYPIDPRD